MYYGSGLYKLVKEVVSTCPLCQRYNGTTTKTHELVPILALKPFQIIGIDAVGPINPISNNDNRFILTAIDYCTKWPIAQAVSNIQSETVINFILTEIVQQYGVPSQIITDRGSNFLSDITLDFYKTLDIKHTPTTTYRPQSNGQVERLNRTLKNTLAKICADNESDWDAYIWKALLAIKSMKNQSTGFSPAMLLYGQNITLPSAWKEPEGIIDIDEAIKERISFLNAGIEGIRNIGHRKNVKSKNNSSNRYNSRVIKSQYQIGDRVLKHTDVLKSKFSAVWEGPYTVSKAGNKGAYTIMDSSGNFDITHGDKLKPYRESNRMIPEVSSSKLNSTLQRFRSINIIEMDDYLKGGGLLHI
ncbi:Retrovirus-related Pol polyprotein from transposon [Smittium culicis]|uniref:Retrovirus-related Pol polyprotein from transposon n=1 Tax=Smittium culicis TaxID=133412 RepID=A0A1R1XP67_9FUNG|nr:Retrovirus-related Pol polyprotein from transposon [Smittium culicis]